MNELTFPEPSDSADKSSRRQGGKKSRAERPKETPQPVASREQCLAILTQIGTLVTVGVLTPARANAIRMTYSEILRYHERQESGPSPAVVNENDLAQLLREHPEYGKLLEPLLSKEQIETLLGAGRDAADSDDAP